MNLSNMNRYDVLFQEFNEKKQRMLEMLHIMFDTVGMDEFWKYGAKVSRDSFINPSRDTIPELDYVRKYLHHDNMIKFLNTEYWQKVINETGVMDYVSSSVKKQWRDSLQKHDMPPFEMETVKSALANLLQDLPRLFKQRLQDAHSVISKGHKTNSAEMFNKRMIFTVASFDHSSGYYDICDFLHHTQQCDAINDIRSTISQLNGGQQIKTGDTRGRLAMIAKSGNWGEWVKIDEHVAVRLYKVGTCHLEIRPEIADMLNSVIADGTIPNMSESWYQKKKDKPVKEFHDMTQVVLSNDELMALDKLNWNARNKDIEYILERIDNQYYFDGGYKFSYDIKPVIEFIKQSKMMPDYKTHQYYPTPSEIVDEMYKHVDATKKVLEPSAGTGNIIRNLENVTAIELASLHCKILQSKGINTINADFLQYNSTEKYDIVLMNPPYSKGRALSHVDHAVKFLSDDGYILAVLPTGKVNQIKHSFRVIKIFKGVFDNTNIDTTLVKIWRD